jgi:hypothetical protein
MFMMGDRSAGLPEEVFYPQITQICADVSQGFLAPRRTAREEFFPCSTITPTSVTSAEKYL